MHELKVWLLNHGFAVVTEEILDFGVVLVVQPPLGKTMTLVFHPNLPPEELIDMVRQMYQVRLEKLN